MNSRILLLLAVVFLLWTIGCSGGGNIPVAPDTSGSPVSPAEKGTLEPVGGPRITEGDSELRVPVAFYTFKADPDAGTLDVELLRAANMHMNGVPYLEDGPENLLKVVGPPKFSNGGKQLDVNIKITHPNADPLFTGFDVHGTFITKGTMGSWNDPTVILAGPNETRLMNPDGMTRWWNPREFTKYGVYGYDPGELGSLIPGNEAATINGYKTFADGLGELSTMSDLNPANRGMFSVGTSCTRHYTLSLKGGLVFNYAVDLSWAFPTKLPPTPPGDFPIKANMPEPYWIEVEEWVNTLV